MAPSCLTPSLNVLMGLSITPGESWALRALEASLLSGESRSSIWPGVGGDGEGGRGTHSSPHHSPETQRCPLGAPSPPHSQSLRSWPRLGRPSATKMWG